MAVRSRSTTDKVLRHPLTLALIPVAVGAAGWAFNRYVIDRDRSDLRLEVQDLAQAIPVTRPAPAIEGEPVFCETAKLTLLLAHNGDGKQPIVVHALAFRVEPVEPERRLVTPACEVDLLQTHPYWIDLINTYILEAAGTRRSGRYIESAQPDSAPTVEPDNILRAGRQRRSVSLSADEKPVTYDVFVELKTAGLYRAWFTAAYDARGARTAATPKFYLAR
jgi:hypothetical protein